MGRRFGSSLRVTDVARQSTGPGTVRVRLGMATMRARVLVRELAHRSTPVERGTSATRASPIDITDRRADGRQIQRHRPLVTWFIIEEGVQWLSKRVERRCWRTCLERRSLDTPGRSGPGPVMRQRDCADHYVTGECLPMSAMVFAH